MLGEEDVEAGVEGLAALRGPLGGLAMFLGIWPFTQKTATLANYVALQRLSTLYSLLLREREERKNPIKGLVGSILTELRI